MFNTKSKDSTVETSSGSITIIGPGTTITGNIESTGDIRIDGTLEGNVVSTSRVLIGAEGSVAGDIYGQQADVVGMVKGKIQVADLLQLRGKANVKGDIYAGKLQIEPSVTFNGQCHMGANVVELNAEISNVANQ